MEPSNFFDNLHFPWAKNFQHLTSYLDPITKYTGFFALFLHIFHVFVLKELRAHFLFAMLLGIAICDVAWLTMGSLWEIAVSFQDTNSCIHGNPYYFTMGVWIGQIVVVISHGTSTILTLILAVFNQTFIKSSHTLFIIILSVAGMAVIRGNMCFRTRIHSFSEDCYVIDPSPVSDTYKKAHFFVEGIIFLIVSGLFLIYTFYIPWKVRRDHLNLKNPNSQNNYQLIAAFVILYFLDSLITAISSLLNYTRFSIHTENAAYLIAAFNNIVMFNITTSSICHVVACISLSSEYRGAIRSLFGCSGKGEFQIYPDDIVKIPLESGKSEFQIYPDDMVKIPLE